jgi:sugar phosphate isomerase/epimerase
MAFPFAMSTCWNTRRHTNGHDILQELVDLGFDKVELGHGTWISLLAGIIESPLLGDSVQISSLHNFCPLPVGALHPSPNLYNLSSYSQRERTAGIKNTFRTIDTAQRLGAKVVVLHMGSMALKNFTRPMVQLAESGMMQSSKFERLFNKYHKKRERLQPKYFPLLLDSLKRLEDYAGDKGIKLGIEVRSGLEELPTEPDILRLLDETSPEVVGFWHDVGHAQLKENLGVINHLRWVERFAPRMVGMHIQDIQPVANDHLPPGMGTFPFESLREFVHSDMALVLELHPRAKPEDVVKSAEWLEDLWEWPAQDSDETTGSAQQDNPETSG